MALVCSSGASLVSVQYLAARQTAVPICCYASSIRRKLILNRSMYGRGLPTAACLYLHRSEIEMLPPQAIRPQLAEPSTSITANEESRSPGS